MALGGDIVFKLAADYAQLSQGMDAVKQKLDQVAEQAKTTSEQIESLTTSIKSTSTAMETFKGTTLGHIAGEAIRDTIEGIKQYIAETSKMGAEFQKQAELVQLTSEQYQALSLRSHETGESMKTLTDYAKTHSEWLERVTEDARAAGLVMGGELTDGMKRMADQSYEADLRFRALVASFTTPVKLWIVDAVDSIGTALKDAWHWADDFNKALDELLSKGVSGVADKYRELRQIRQGQEADAFARQAYGTTATDVIPTTKAHASGGGGKGLAEELDEMAKRAKAAQEAMAALAKDTTTAFEQVRHDVELDRSVTDKIAELGKRDPGGAMADRIKATTNEMLRSQDALKLYEKAAAEADATVEKFDDGSRLLARTQNELAKQLTTGRLDVDLYNRAMTEAADKARTQKDEFDKLAGGIKGFSAGLDDAAHSFAKAHTTFAAGEQTFNALTGAMDEGLDVLAGKSSKTFGDIAQDFTLMLAKMAAQAALSPVFSAIFGAIGGGSLGTQGAGVANWMFNQGGTAPGGGSGIFSSIASWVGGLFGGARQGGGDVSPGLWYTVGEHGPEKFVPPVAGRIEPASSGPRVTVHNYGAQVETRSAADGGLDVTVRAVKRALTHDVIRGGNDFAGALERTYGVGRGR